MVEVLHVRKLPRVRAGCVCRADVLVHHVDVRLVDTHSLLGYLGRIIDGHVVQLGVRLPVLVEDQEQLLRAAERKDGDQAAPTALDDLVDGACEALLALLARLVDRGAVRRLGDEHVRRVHRDLGAE